MLQRPVLLLLISSFNGCLVNGCFINGNGQAQGEAKDNGNGNASDNGNGNASGNGSGNGNGNGNGNGAPPGDGVWDITTTGGGAVGPSEMVIAGTRATGFVASKGEGQQDPSNYGCTRTKDRTEFQFDTTGDAISGTVTVVTYWSGYGCPGNAKHTTPLTGARLKPGQNNLDGDWSLAGPDRNGDSVTFHLSTTSGTMSAASNRPDLSFAARKR